MWMLNHVMWMFNGDVKHYALTPKTSDLFCHLLSSIVGISAVVLRWLLFCTVLKVFGLL